MFCQYRDSLGKPNEGFHSTRLFGMAAYDVLGTIIIIIALAYYFDASLLMTAGIVTIITVLAHRLFCVNTALNTKIFGVV
jgi:hypothetical protein